MLKPFNYTLLIILASGFGKLVLASSTLPDPTPKVRELVDPVGFAQHPWQMDSIFARMDKDDLKENTETYKAVICPHDDYAYAAGLYNKTLSGIKAKTVLMIGVAHKAKDFDLADQFIFGSFDEWKCVYGNIKVSPLRNQLIDKLHSSIYEIHDDMMQKEHSLEAINPFLQHNNKSVEIIPILVPYMKLEDMMIYTEKFAAALAELMKEQNLELGKDLAIVISNDAVHYGDEDWGGKDLAPLGTDMNGNMQAIEKDKSLIKTSLIGEITDEKVTKFYYTCVQNKDYTAYKWVWCGRYSVPFGLLVSQKLNKSLGYKEELSGTLIEYRNSWRNPHIGVGDLEMGVTAPANDHHWVGYVGVAYK